MIPLNGKVLIKPDPHYDTYQFKGRETGILASNTSYIQHEGKQKVVDVSHYNYSVRGTVVGVPQFLNVPDEKFHSLEKGTVKEGPYKGFVNDRSTSESYQNIAKTTSKYDCDIELEIGERVFMSWKVHHSNPEYFYHQGERLMLVSYDELVMVVDENNRPSRMLNGWILFKSIEDNKLKNEDGVNYKESTSGLFLPVLSEKKQEMRKGNSHFGECVLSGRPNRGYKEYPGERDENYPIEVGERMIVDRRGVRNLEQQNHNEYAEKYYITHRKFIIFTEKTAKDQGIEFEKLMV